MKYVRFYYHEESGMLVDVVDGIFKYNPNSQSMLLTASIKKREHRVFACLSAYKNTLVTRELVSSQAWEGKKVSENSLTIAIYNLRKLLMIIDPECRCLETVNKIGYAFLPERAGLVPVASLDFLLDSLRWSADVHLPITLPANNREVITSKNQERT